jgi:hypothetical protein
MRRRLLNTLIAAVVVVGGPLVLFACARTDATATSAPSVAAPATSPPVAAGEPSGGRGGGGPLPGWSMTPLPPRTSKGPPGFAMATCTESLHAARTPVRAGPIGVSSPPAYGKTAKR